jgi:1,4-alpha-glucan branching enzyme
MLSLESDGRLLLMIHLPGATRVEVVGTFDGYHEERYPMTQVGDGRWTLEITPGDGEFLFRYLIDGSYCVLDNQAHGTRISAAGHEMSRVWLPPRSFDPDAIAA